MNPSEKKYDFPVALVTGGACRLGKHIVDALSKHFHMAIHHFRSPIDTLSRTSPSYQYFQSDLTSPGAPAKLIADTIANMNRLDIIVNNAALFIDDAAPLINLAKMKALNVDAPRKIIDAARPHLRKTCGQIINIADIAGLRPFFRYKAYSKSKTALIEFTRTEALSLARDQIRINTICPGIVLPSVGQQEDALDFLQQQIPLNRIGKPQDVAELVAFLAKSSFITGQTICVDGGRLLAPIPDSKK